MSFLDQFSVWEILVGLLLILVVNTVVFKLLVDWNQAQPLDDGEALAAPPGPASLPTGDLESSASFATASVPPSNRPRRRKHLQAAVTSEQTVPAGVETRPETNFAAPVAAVAPAMEKPAPEAESATPASVPILSFESARPLVSFSAPELEKPVEPEPVAAVDAVAPIPEPVIAEEKTPVPSESVPVPTMIVPEPVVAAQEMPVPALNLASTPPVTDLSDHPPAVNTIAPEPPAPAETATSRKVEDVIPSSDLVLHPPADAPAKLPAEAPPAPVTARSSFRRAIAPARLFLTREFSSVRIRSRQLTEPEPAAPAPAPEPALRSSEPATAAEIPPAEVPSTPEPVTLPPTAEVIPAPELVEPAPPPTEPTPAVMPETPAAELVAPPVITPEPEPEPVAAIEPAPTVITEPEPVTALHPNAPEPEPEAPAPAPVVEAAAPPAPEPVLEPAPEPVAEVAEVIPTAGLMHLPEPSETLPVVDITPEPAILPPPAALVHEEEAPVIHPEPVVSQPIAPFIPIPHMASVQPVTGERATAQLTLSLEVASLQLTPAFKLGSVQLRPLSNVVSLQLGAGVGPQPADNPLSANISFEIQSVQTGGDGQIQSLVLKPLPAARADTTPHPKLQVDAVQLTRGVEAGPIQITPASATSTAVQLMTTYAIAGIDFTPNFEIGTMRLEPVTRTVMLRLNQPGGADLPPAFEIANVQLGGDAQISMVQLTPTTL